MARPTFTIVTAVYNVEPYLPDFIASVESQRFDLRRVEVIAVNDGSTDGSLAILEAWVERRPGLVKVLSKPNGGQASARNLGLEHATGEWVTFTDADDLLDPNFLRVAARFADRHAEVEVLSARPVLLAERIGRLSDSHPRRSQYDAGDRQVDLEDEPSVFPALSAGSLLKVDRIHQLGLRFDEKVRPNFEDGHLVARYILSLPRPIIGILHGAKYIYRKRAANDSTLQRSKGDAGRYSDVLRFGYLDLIEQARLRPGSVPEWLQHLLIYELSWYLSDDEQVSSAVTMPEDLLSTFHDLFRQVVAGLDPEVVRRHAVRPMRSVWLDIFAFGCRSEDWHSPAAARTSVDGQMGLQRVCYRYTGAPPSEQWVLDGTSTEPAYTKVMSHFYYGAALMHERIAWLPAAGALQLSLNGRNISIGPAWPEPERLAGPTSLQDRVWLARQLPLAYVAGAVLSRTLNLAARLLAPAVRLTARAKFYRVRFENAWVLMDRIRNSDDNAERLFEYLRAERSDVNAWFVVEKGTADWERMRGIFADRLVAHGSFRWIMLMLNCSWLVSSHFDAAILRPRRVMSVVGSPSWKFAFLQHGVIKDDLSMWLNNRGIDMFVVSTDAELASVTADGSSYDFTMKETRKTGLPRFDRLLAKGRELASNERDLIIVAPTWRRWLTMPLPGGSHRRVEDEFWTSTYFHAWDAIVRSPRIADAAVARNWRIGFMPHPNMQPVLELMELPPSIEPLAFVGTDVQALYARCALLVTDYSSVAFNVAYLDRPVVYFQFDFKEVMSGAHVGRRGYFDYGRDGFGPVATDVEQAVEAIVASIENGPFPTPEYQGRIDRTFTNRDGNACRRVVAAIEELSRPYRPPGDVTRDGG